MSAVDYIKDYIKKTAPLLDKIFKEKEKEAARMSPITAEMMRIYRKFMGGKNIRGALIKLGYECFGGKSEKEILKASLMIEIAHAFLIMHDDIMDNDRLRRGMPTIHLQYEQLHQKRYAKGDSEHYGKCLAIDLGDAGFTLANLLLIETDFPSKVKLKVLRRFNEVILTTAFGQAMDISFENSEKFTEDNIIKVHSLKTANYTITAPLQYGALLAGKEGGKVEKIKNYGLPVGIAFQLRDDELGLFSDEKTLGKPIASDVGEDKITMLHLKSLELASPKDKKFLEYAYGNRHLTPKEIERVRGITVKTGALAYSQKLSKDLVKKGKKFVPQITTNPKFQDLLYKMADYMIERNS